jgi:hypothetical protein
VRDSNDVVFMFIDEFMFMLLFALLRMLLFDVLAE